MQHGNHKTGSSLTHLLVGEAAAEAIADVHLDNQGYIWADCHAYQL